jgi:hypothetical protein
MSESITVEGKEYISSKRASQLSGYAQDYIGQLARSSQIDAQRIGGLWYVSMESLEGYKVKAESYKPEPPERKPTIVDPEALISFDGKDYISAARAAKLTGYHQDYIGQLARAGTVLSRQVGNRWYVERDAILAHKKEKDALLAAVQSESVGLVRESSKEAVEVTVAPTLNSEPLMRYTNENEDLMPVLQNSAAASTEERTVSENTKESEETSIPIRVIPKRQILHHTEAVKRVKPVRRTHEKTNSYAMLAASALTIVIVLSFGFSTLKTQSIYSAGTKGGLKGMGPVANTASAAEAFSWIGDLIENLVVPEIVYRRSD